MAITYTADVWCDSEGCSEWASGVTGDKPPRKGLARAAVRADGFHHHLGKDYCRACWKRMWDEATAARRD